MAKNRKVRSFIALGIIVVVGLVGAGFLAYKWLHRPPAEARAWARANTLMSAVRYEEVCEEAARCLGHGEYDFPARRLIARARVNLKQFDEAERVLDEGLTEARLQDYRAGQEILRAEREKLSGEERAKRLAQLEKEMEITHKGYVEYLQLQLLKVGVHLSHVQSLVSEHPDSLTLTAETEEDSPVRRLIEEKTYESDKALVQLVGEHPERAEVYQMLGDFYKVRQQFVQTSVNAYMKEANHFQLMDNLTAAASARRRAQEIASEVPALRMRAIWAYQNACRIDPESADSHLALAALLSANASPDYAQALKELDAVLKKSERISPQQVLLAKVLHADLLRRTGQLNQAIENMALLHKTNERNIMVVLMYLDLLLERVDTSTDATLRQADLQEARRVATEADKQTQSSELKFYKNRVLLEQGEAKDAVAGFSMILDNPADQDTQLITRTYYYLGKAQLFETEKARQVLAEADQKLSQAQQGSDPKAIEEASKARQTAEQAYQALAMKASTGLASLNEAIKRLRLIRPLLPPDRRKWNDDLLVNAETMIVHTMMARGDLGDVPERVFQILSNDIDNELGYQLLSKAIEREKNTEKSRHLTVTAVYYRLMSGKPELARQDAEKAISVFGMTPAQARKELDEAAGSDEKTQKVLMKVRNSEQLYAAAGTARLLEGTVPAGLSHFQVASELHKLTAPGQDMPPDVYAQEMYCLLCRILLGRGMGAEAEQVLDKGIEQFPRGEKLFVTKAGLAQRRGRLGAAIEAYKRAIELAPKSGEIYTMLAGLYLDMGMNEEAAQEVGRIPADAPRSLPLLVNMGQIYSRLKDFDKLRKVADELVRRFGGSQTENFRVRLLAASFYADCGDFAQASKLAGNIPETIQVRPELKTELAKLFVQQAMLFIGTGEYEKSVQALERVMSIRPDDLSFFVLGLLYLQLDDQATEAGTAGRKVIQTIELAQKVSRDYPEFTHARLLEAVAQYHAGKTATALEILEPPIPVGRGNIPSSQVRQQLQVLFLLDQGQLNAAFEKVSAPGGISGKLKAQVEAGIRDMLTKISQLPVEKRRKAIKSLARTYLAKRVQVSLLAMKCDEELVSLLPDDPVAVVALATSYQNVQQIEKARTLLVEHLKAHPDFAEAWYRLALICDQAGKLDEAETALRKFMTFVDDAIPVEQ